LFFKRKWYFTFKKNMALGMLIHIILFTGLQSFKSKH
jgi:hypothetical protein